MQNSTDINGKSVSSTQSERFRGPVVQAVLAIVGLAVSALTYVMLPLVVAPVTSTVSHGVLELIALGCVLGFILRVARRYVFFHKIGTVHQSFSFEAIFQGAIAFNPQLEYPGVESAFLNRIGRMPTSLTSGWFAVRATSAVAIPLALIGLALTMVGKDLSAAMCFLVSICWTWLQARKRHTAPERLRFLLAEFLGIAAAVVEGLSFTLACLWLYADGSSGQFMLLYLALLSAYEFSPVPFALGVLEIAYLILQFIPGFSMPGLVVVLLYRAFRLLVLVWTALYLPRYKLNLKDVVNPELAFLLRKFFRPEGGWAYTADDSNTPRLSIVIPAYNEAERLPVYLPQVVEYCEGIEGDTEILVVDDGSTDSTAEYVGSIIREHPIVRLLKQSSNQGKGAAVKRGAMESRGAYVLFADADGATPIREADRLLETAETGIEVVIASRTAAGGHAKRSLLRSLVGAMFYRLTNLLAVPTVSDTQCGFKLFRRFAAQKVFSQVKETGWAFDVEVLFLAQKYDYAIREVPVEWNAVAGSKVNLIKDSLSMLWALWRIRHRNAGMTDME